MSKAKIGSIPCVETKSPRTINFEELSMLAAYGVSPDDLNCLGDEDRASLREELRKHDVQHRNNSEVICVRARLLDALCRGKIKAYGFPVSHNKSLFDLLPTWATHSGLKIIPGGTWTVSGHLCLFTGDYWSFKQLFTGVDLSYENIVFDYADAMVFFVQPIIGKVPVERKVRQGRPKEYDPMVIQNTISEVIKDIGCRSEMPKQSELIELVRQKYRETVGAEPPAVSYLSQAFAIYNKTSH